MKARIIYILGAGHSGSTLLSMLLGGHPACVTFGELSAFDQVVLHNKPCTCGQPILGCEFWRTALAAFAGDLAVEQLPAALPTDDRRGTYAPSLVQWRYLLAASLLTYSPFPLPLSVIRNTSPTLHQRTQNTLRLYDVLAETAQRSHLVDASKSMVRMKMLLALRPEELKIIYLTRDVRAVSASLTKRVKALPPSPEQKAKEWVRANRYCLAALRAVPAHKTFHLRYEALCRAPEVVTRELFDFLGLESADEILSQDSRQMHIIGGNPMRFRGIRSIEEDVAWRSRLAASDLTTIERIAGTMNRRLLGPYYQP